MQLEGLFDVAPSAQSEICWTVHLPLEDADWDIGLIVGPSGCGKSTIARQLFGQDIIDGYEWPHDLSIVDAFPQELGVREIAALLSSVGFSSPPAWLRPFRVLSNGEQFRVTLARALTESKGTVVIDEFSSVVDRTVARIGSAAVARTIRRRRQIARNSSSATGSDEKPIGLGETSPRFVAVSCHYDIIDWLDPDWVYDPTTDRLRWRRERLPRPLILLRIQRVHRDAWKVFRRHHYLSGALHPAARCFAASVGDRPAAYAAVIHFPHPRRSGWREHRIVCLPDFQGVGIGNALSEFVAALFLATGKPYRSTTSHPGLIRHRARSSVWKMIRPPSRSGTGHQLLYQHGDQAFPTRITAGFEFVGQPRQQEAREFGIL